MYAVYTAAIEAQKMDTARHRIASHGTAPQASHRAQRRTSPV
jgi:hypothetical protein